MESHKIKPLLEKYFDGETSIEDERILKNYFSSDAVAPEFNAYKDLFGLYITEKTLVSTREFPIRKEANTRHILGIAASVAVVVGIGFMLLKTQPEASADLGSFDDPEIALIETQKALALIGQNLNKGKESISYLNEYEVTRNILFK
ncbi:MAG TPA: hypothetical protein VLZ11_03945 [Flavobacterium sp.]|nr:hypothetical protein [Flavobacterium sp.]